MIFHHVEPGEHYRNLRLISAEGIWTLGLCLFSSGLRLRMGKTGRPPSVLDFCLGTDPAIYAPALDAVVRRLEPLMENSTPGQIDAVFPWAGTRPDLEVHLNFLLAPDINKRSADKPSGA